MFRQHPRNPSTLLYYDNNVTHALGKFRTFFLGHGTSSYLAGCFGEEREGGMASFPFDVVIFDFLC